MKNGLNISLSVILVFLALGFIPKLAAKSLHEPDTISINSLLLNLGSLSSEAPDQFHRLLAKETKGNSSDYNNNYHKVNLVNLKIKPVYRWGKPMENFRIIGFQYTDAKSFVNKILNKL
ncbi:MAG: hypothetical protein ACNS62_23620 [Candidatus Cyclobacteriaceae bacterium M3_2C_046]